MNTLSAENSLVLIIDIQERLVAALEKDTIVANAVKIASAAKALEIPVLLTEQYPKGLGHTVPQLQEVLPENSEVVEKTYFNALLEDGMLEKIKAFGKKQIVIFGIETHICVHQTASALIEAGFDVYVIKDGQPVRTAVSTGVTGDTNVQILKGLSEGDEIIVSGDVTAPKSNVGGPF